MFTKYALITDNSTQSQSYLIRTEERKEIINYNKTEIKENKIEFYDLPFLTGEIRFFDNIYHRECSFTNQYFATQYKTSIPSIFQGQSFYGWWISEYEFDRIKKLISLYPSIQEFRRLSVLEKI